MVQTGFSGREIAEQCGADGVDNDGWIGENC